MWNKYLIRKPSMVLEKIATFLFAYTNWMYFFDKRTNKWKYQQEKGDNIFQNTY